MIYKLLILLMDLKSEKTALMKRLEQINDKSLIKAINHIIDFGLGKIEERISIEQYNRELDEADSAIDRGDFYTQEEVEKKSKQW